MDRKKVILLVAALLIAAITAFMARSMFTGAAAPQAAAVVAPVNNGPKVLVATRALPVGTIITAEALRYQPWPKELIEEAYFKEGAEGTEGTSMESLVGTVVRNAVTAGQPITQGSLVKPGDRGFLAAALGPGMRAVHGTCISINGCCRLRLPRRPRRPCPHAECCRQFGPALKVSETIIRNLRVLATDQRAQPLGR